MNNRRAIISLTDKAIEQIRLLIDSRDQNKATKTLGIRVKTPVGGCSGLSYKFEFADEKAPFEEEVEQEGVRVLIDPKAIMYVIGSIMDYKETDAKSGFIFVNPNSKGECGCGKSFNV